MTKTHLTRNFFKISFFFCFLFLISCNDTPSKSLNEKSENDLLSKVSDTIPVISPFTDKEDSLKANKELDYFENKLKHSFWTKFQQTNKYGRKYGSIEINFSQNEYEKFALNQGFSETENGSLMDYDGIRNGFHIYLDNNGAVPSSSGWVQKWKIRAEKQLDDTIYKLERELLLNPN